MTCKPTGRPFDTNPHGTEAAGLRARLTGKVKGGPAQGVGGVRLVGNGDAGGEGRDRHGRRQHQIEPREQAVESEAASGAFVFGALYRKAVERAPGFDEALQRGFEQRGLFRPQGFRQQRRAGAPVDAKDGARIVRPYGLDLLDGRAPAPRSAAPRRP